MAAGRRRGGWDGPRPIQTGVARVMHHLHAPQPTIVQSVFDHWEALVGDVIAAHCRPAKIVSGVLVIEVDDPAWASELTWLSSDLVRRIQKQLETNEINEISVKLAR